MNIETKQTLLLDLIKASLVSYHVFATVADELSNELNISSTVKIKEILEAVLEEGKVNTLPEEDIDITLYIYTKHSLELIATLIDAIGIGEGERITKSLIEYSDYLHNRIYNERMANKHAKLAKFKEITESSRMSFRAVVSEIKSEITDTTLISTGSLPKGLRELIINHKRLIDHGMSTPSIKLSETNIVGELNTTKELLHRLNLIELCSKLIGDDNNEFLDIYKRHIA